MFNPIRKELYSSIKEEILEEDISFAKLLIDTDNHKTRTIKHCRKSLLFHKNVAWKKKTMASCFDVTMGTYDGVEVCELVGIYFVKTGKHHWRKEYRSFP